MIKLPLKLLVTRKLPDAAEKAMAGLFTTVLNPGDTPQTADTLIANAEGCDAIACTSMDKFPSDVLKRLPQSVKIIATVSVGHEHLDLPAARARGIAVTNTPDVLTDATADISMLLILGAARGAYRSEKMVRENRWPPPSMVTNLGSDVSGQRLGILGMGRIGQAVARRARGFDMKLHYHNRKPVDVSLSEGAIYHANFEAMLPHIDFLSVNCAMTPETKNLINAKTIALLPKGAIIVNAARGGVIDDDALIAALKSGHIAAAGLDVFANEPNLDPRYRDLENSFLLPHIGSATMRTRLDMGMRALSNVEDFFAGRTPRDLLN
jgi:lactate dehydrogenase-like 2-hydroxyacid dehydrogenase